MLNVRAKYVFWLGFCTEKYVPCSEKYVPCTVYGFYTYKVRKKYVFLEISFFHKIYDKTHEGIHTGKKFTKKDL